MADKTFYIVPTINPDARDSFIHKANTAHSPRTGLIPIDNDRDGVDNEDGFDDLDGVALGVGHAAYSSVEF